MAALLYLVVRWATPKEVQAFVGLVDIAGALEDPDEMQEMLDHIDLLLSVHAA